MYALILEPLYSAPDDIDDPKADWRNVSTGNIIPDKNYCDQPYVVKTDDNAWLCIMTTGSGHEGQEGQHIITIRSTDFGQSWSEPVNVEPPDGPEASYAVLLKAPNGRIFAFYNHNTDNIRKVKGYYDSGYTRRVDSQGYFVFKYSDDHGKSWSDQRYTIPIRNMDIDRKNPYQGEIQYFWNVGKPFIHSGAAYVSVHKVGGYGYGFFTRSEGVLLKSTNLLTVSDPERASWETLPEGEFGIRAPDGAGPIAEEQSYVVLDDGSFFTVFRTISGHPGCAYSRDGGYSWEPSKFMQYATGRLMKHPRAANFVWKCDNGNYLYWFHNNGHMYYNSGYSGGSRNVAWLCGGIEKGGRIYWSQPEVILYEDDHLKGPSYPDFIEDEGRYFITETQKFQARVHELDANWVEGLWKQFTRSELTTAGLVLELDQNELKEKHVFQAPVLPAVSGSVDRSVRMYTAKGRGGFTFDMNICLHDFEPGQIGLDTRKPSGRGIWVTTTHQQTLRFEMCDGWSTAAWECDKGLLEPNVDHHVTIIVDGGPKIISFVIDGILNDGGEQRPLGWGRFSHHLKDANGSVNLKVGPHLNGQVKTLRVYDRAIRVTEAIGNFRYVRKAAE
jgi:hypothetical protein